MARQPRPRRSLLRAVIDEARRRARRRRERYVLGLVVLAAVGGFAYFSFHGGKGTAVARAVDQIEIAPIVPSTKNGALTIMDVRSNAKHEGPVGWYGLSSVDSTGHLHTLVRCPHRVRRCGWVESVAWSPDGRRLAFAVTSISEKSRFDGIHIANLRTGREIQIVRGGKYGEHDWQGLAWAPDGLRLAYSSAGIVLINADGSGRTVLRTSARGFDRAPSWSPNGAWIAFASSGPQEFPAIWAARADGSQSRQLVRLGAAPAWSPDGTRIAFRAPSAQIEFVSPNGKLLSPRPPFRAGVSIGIDGPPVWSPDGKKIAMSRRRHGTYVMNADGTNLERLTPYAVGVSIGEPRPAWRPRP